MDGACSGAAAASAARHLVLGVLAADVDKVLGDWRGPLGKLLGSSLAEAFEVGGGFSCLGVISGHLAISLAERHRFDAVV